MKVRAIGLRAFTLGWSIAACLTVSIPASAQGPGWTATSTIVKLVDTFNGGVNIRLTPDLSGCTSQSGYGPAFASLYPTHPGIDRIKATLLTAYVTGTPVSIYLGDNTCTVTEVILGGW